MRKVICLFAVSLGIAAIAAPAWAHHGASASMEETKTVEVSGVVTEVQWRNPHVYINLDVPAEGGKTEKWVFELSALRSVLNAGVTPTIVKVGKQVKIIAHPAKDPNIKMGSFMGVEVDGKIYGHGTMVR